MADEAPPSNADAGSLKRGVQILKILAAAGARGLALTELASRTGLPHPTVHRVLRQLVEERLVARNDELRRYRLGPLAVELGLAGSMLYDMRDLCEKQMDQVSVETGDTVYLIVRSGVDGVCMQRHEGSFPIRTLVLDVGSRRPLGIGAGGLALLAALGDDERHAVLTRIESRLPTFGGTTAAELEQACLRAREERFAVVHDAIYLGVTAVGHAFHNAMGQPVGALTVATLTQRMTRERVQRIAQLLHGACAEIETVLKRHQNDGWQFGP